ncbi:hypothetical protein IFM89_024849 [Coptis chinensis]|uniref:Glycosyltransferase n=1 Tax=Coptis chinensis TaxID=261450 RepID=A0A835HPQ0_9MAGN|nr:hypothetical protein IFM89_024849 [Coptis chinensis]
MEQTQQTPHIIIHPSPGMGHLIPLAEFAKRLVLLHDFTVTLVIPIENNFPTESMKLFLIVLPEGIDYIFLPSVNFDDLPHDTRAEARICLLMNRSIPLLRHTFMNITSTNHVVALVVDLFGSEAFEVAREFKVPPYMFFPASAMSLSLLLHLQELDETYDCEFRDIPEPIKLPGCVPFKGIDVMDGAKDKTNVAYKMVLHISTLYSSAEGILINTFGSLENETLKALNQLGKPPIFPVGPLIQLKITSDDSECIKFLNEQPRGSVLFVSFGSGGTLSHSQLLELALGLELSGERFLWVIRSPGDATNATYFEQKIEDPFDFLPNGFLDRTKGLGLVVPSWAPQIQVLSHVSTGGFVTHCGWNSILESIMHGVPLIAWPLYAEQKMNAEMITAGLKIALRPKVDEKFIVDREEVARTVKCLMREEEGNRIRERINELKDAGFMMLNEDGSSTKALSEVANMWKK